MRRRVLISLATNPVLERAILAVPGGRERAWRSARRYVGGERLEEAVAVARSLASQGLTATLDLFGEGVDDPGLAARVADAYVELAGALAGTPPSTWLALDLSHVGFDAGHLRRIAAALPAGRLLQVGAEEAATTDRVLGAVTGAVATGLPVAATLQANLRRSPADADRLAAAGIPVRLVKGAYAESPAVAHAFGAETDRAYAALAHRLHAAGGLVSLATHDDALLEPLLADLPAAPCEQLLGVRPERAHALVARGRAVRIYVPFGPQWLRYLLRLRAEAQRSG